MELTVRKMNESRWAGVKARAFAQDMVCRGGIEYAAGLMRLSAKDPVYAGRGENRLKIVDEGYLWLQLAPRDGWWWLTAMYDEKARLVQFYFDITLGNLLAPDGESRFADAFADVVISPGQEPRIVDEDELWQAVQEGLLSREQAELVMDRARLIALKYRDCEELVSFCRRLLDGLFKQL